MQEGSNENQAGAVKWTLTVYHEGPKAFSTYTFDEEPEAKPGSKIVIYRGQRDGQQQSVYVNIDKSTHWTLTERSGE